MATETRKIIDITSSSKAEKFFPRTIDTAVYHNNADGTTINVKDAIDSKQDKLTFDTTPTAGSTKPVTSGGIKTALDEQVIFVTTKAQEAQANATSASVSATNASASEANAKASETNAGASASSASASAETATEQATIATTKAQEAQASATSAEQSAQEAEEAKTSASESASKAQEAYDKAYDLSNARCGINQDGELVIDIPEGATFSFAIEDNSNLEVVFS